MAGRMRTVEVFLNFPLMDMNMNVLRHNPDKVDPRQAARMDTFWGDGSWREAAYRKRKTLFGEIEVKARNEAVCNAYRTRLRKVAGFTYVPEPMPMVNRKGAVVYYLLFASPKPVAAKIVEQIFNKYRRRGVP